jgi:hypothetical protein
MTYCTPEYVPHENLPIPRGSDNSRWAHTAPETAPVPEQVSAVHTKIKVSKTGLTA